MHGRTSGKETDGLLMVSARSWGRQGCGLFDWSRSKTLTLLANGLTTSVLAAPNREGTRLVHHPHCISHKSQRGPGPLLARFVHFLYYFDSSGGRRESRANVCRIDGIEIRLGVHSCVMTLWATNIGISISDQCLERTSTIAGHVIIWVMLGRRHHLSV